MKSPTYITLAKVCALVGGCGNQATHPEALTFEKHNAPEDLVGLLTAAKRLVDLRFSLGDHFSPYLPALEAHIAFLEANELPAWLEAEEARKAGERAAAEAKQAAKREADETRRAADREAVLRDPVAIARARELAEDAAKAKRTKG